MIKHIFVVILALGLVALIAYPADAQFRAANTKLVGDSLQALVVFMADDYPLPTGPNAAGFFADWRFGGGPPLDSLGRTKLQYKHADSLFTNIASAVGGWEYTVDSLTYKPTIADTGAVKLGAVLVTTDSTSFVQAAETIILDDDGSTDDFIARISLADTTLVWKLGVFQEEGPVNHGGSLSSGLYFWCNGSASNAGLNSYGSGRNIYLVANKAGVLDSIRVVANDSTNRANGTGHTLSRWIELRWHKDVNGNVQAYVNGKWAGQIDDSSLPTDARMTVGFICKNTANETSRQYVGYLQYIGYTHIYPNERYDN